MDTAIIATYCVGNELLQAVHHHNDAQCKMIDAEVMTTAFVAALYFRGNLERARMMLKTYGYIPQMLSKSRLNRRLHQIQALLLLLFHPLGALWKTLNLSFTTGHFLTSSITIWKATGTDKSSFKKCSSSLTPS